MNFLYRKWKKIFAGVMTFFMIYSVLSGTIDVYAYEVGKIGNSNHYGEYYQTTINHSKNLNVVQNDEHQEILRKDPKIVKQENEYPNEWEVEEKRTKNSKTYKLPDGSYIEKLYFEPIFKEQDGKLEEIDNSLEPANVNTRQNPIIENKNGAYHFLLKNDTVELENEHDEVLKFKNQEANISVSSIKENAILYSEAYENIDMEYRLSGDKVFTNYYINGKTNQDKITFSMMHDGLTVQEDEGHLNFLREDKSVAFTYFKPTMQDERGAQFSVAFEYVETSVGNIEITLKLDREKVNSDERVYPLLMRSGIQDSSKQILDISTGYIRQLQPYENSQYFDLYVGYENQYWSASSGTPNMGATRTYVHIGDLGLGANQKILNAELKLWKKVADDGQWNGIQVSKSSGYVNPATVTWSNKPSDFTSISTNQIRADIGWQGFIITDYIKDIYAGKNNTLELKATNESSTYLANVFYSESGLILPEISVTYRDDFDVRPDLSIDSFDAEMRVFGISNEGFTALSFDGIAKPDSQVIFELIEKENPDNILGTVTSKDKTNRYFINPIYITDPIANTQTYPKNEINYTTAYINKNDIPEFDVVYEYKVKAKHNSVVSTKDMKTDALIKYKVKLGDTLPSIAAYYGVKIADIKQDNNLQKDIIKEGDTLLVRFKKNNPKISKDLYTPPTKITEYQAKYVNRGPRCVGACDIMDPVNSNTGNYFFEGTDFILKDFEDISFMRYYNSLDPQVSGMFGNGFTSTLESYVSYDKDGNLLYFKGDGKIFKFEKNEAGFKSGLRNKLDIQITDGKIIIQDLSDRHEYRFNSYGYLEAIFYPTGYQSTIEYDEYGIVSKMYLGKKEITFEYNENNLIKSIILPSGNKLTYNYSGRNLVEFSDVVGNKEKYYYDDNNFLTYREDKNGNKTAVNTYDNEGRVLKQIDGNGNETTITYDEGKTIITKADGSVDSYEYNEHYQASKVLLGGQEEKYTYDDKGQITSKTNANGEIIHYYYNGYNLIKIEYSDGTTEEYQYDSSNNIIYHKNQDGTIDEYVYQGSNLIQETINGLTTTYTYDNAHHVISETKPSGETKQYTYIGNQIQSITHSNGLIEYFDYNNNGYVVKESDNQGKVTTYVYDNNEQIIQKNYYDGSNEKWTYDGAGNISSYQDRLGGVTTNIYDKNNNLIFSKKGTLTTINKYDNLNQLIEEIDAQGLSTKYVYDAQGNQIETIDCYGNSIFSEFDVNGNEIKSNDSFGNEEIKEYKNQALIKVISKEGLETRYQYDKFNREIKKENPNGTAVTTEYDVQGNIREVVDEYGNKSQYTYNRLQQEVEIKTTYANGEISVLKKSYDIYGNVITEDLDGAITTHEFDVYGQEISTTDALGNTVRQEYDLDGRIIKEIDALGNAKEIRYNANGDVIEEKDKNGNISIKNYDINGFLISETDALGYITTYVYNNKGQNTEVIDPYKNKTIFIYNDYNQIIETQINGKVIETKKFDAYGREILLDNTKEKISTIYNKFGQVAQTTNELTGVSITNTYDEYGNIVKTEDSEGLITTTEYDNYQNVVKEIDAYGRQKTIIYDERGREIKVEDFNGLISTNTYDISGNVIETKDGLGLVTKNTYDILNQLVRTKKNNVIVEYVYNGNGQLVVEQDNNQNTVIKIEYDANGNEISKADKLGNITKIEYDAKNQVIKETDALGNTSEKVYDANGNTIEEINALGNKTQTKYNEYGLKVMEVDARGFANEYIYDEDFQVIEIIDKLGNSAYFKYNSARQKVEEENQNGGITSYEYDAYGRVIKTIHPNGKIIENTYDKLGNVIEEKAGDLVTTYTYDKKGNVLKKTTNGVVIENNTYNKYNQKIVTLDGNKNESSYEYDSLGNIVISNEKGFITENKYDGYGNLIQKIDNKTYVQDFEYNANNQLLETKVNGKVKLSTIYDANGNEITIIENGFEKQMKYDALNQMIELKIPSSASTNLITFQTLKYDEVGNIIEVIDVNGVKETKEYDANNNLIKDINKKGTQTKYEYDSLGNVIKMQNANERYVTYTYDAMNNVTYKQLNADKVASYSYDIDNNLIKEENEYGYINRYTYDELGNKTSYTTPDGNTVFMTYDNLGNKLTEGSNAFVYDNRNNIIESKNDNGTVKYKYNAFNQMIESIDVNNEIVTYAYNEDNLMINKSYDGISVHQTYDNLGNLESISKNGTVIASYTYNHRGDVIRSIQKDIITDRTYDDLGRTTSQNSNKDGNLIYTAEYVYDNNDNLIKEVINGKENTYVYDQYDELIESNKYINDERIETTYNYDVFGNQVSNSSKEGKKIFHYNTKNQVSSIDTKEGKITLDYDANGNVSKKTESNGMTTTYEYNELNMLRRLNKEQYTYTYKYDGEQNRISEIKKDNKDYHYDIWYDYSVAVDVVSDIQIEDTFAELREQVKKKEANGDVCDSSLSNSYDVEYYKKDEITNFVLDRNEEHVTVLSENGQTNIHGLELIEEGNQTTISGMNGSVVAKIDNDNIQELNYHDYGRVNSNTTGHTYNGEYLDETGLLYLRARYYDPTLSRFIQIDKNYEGTKDDIISQNRYTFTLNNPYKYVDKDGNKASKAISTAGTHIMTILTDSLAKTWLHLDKDEFEKKISGFSALQKKSAWKIYNNRTIFDITTSLAHSVIKSVKNKGSTNNINTGNGKNSTNKKNTSSSSVAETPKLELCPIKWKARDWIDFLLNGVNWGQALKEFANEIGKSYNAGLLKIMANNAKEYVKNGELLTLSGAKQAIKDISKLSKGVKNGIVAGLKSPLKSQIKLAFDKVAIVSAIIEIGLDIVDVVVEIVAQLITMFKAIIKVIVSFVYTIFKTVAISVIKAALIPFIGPFAWLVALVLDVGMTWIEWFIDLKAKISDFVEWMLKNSYLHVAKMITTLNKKK